MTTTDSILNAGLHPLNTAAERRADLSPLVCIGQQVSAMCSSIEFSIEGVFVSPSAQVVIVLPKRPEDDEIQSIISELRTWDFDAIDNMAQDYTWQTMGQALSIIDIMALHGHLTFSDELILSRCINRRMSAGGFVLLCME